MANNNNNNNGTLLDRPNLRRSLGIEEPAPSKKQAKLRTLAEQAKPFIEGLMIKYFGDPLKKKEEPTKKKTKPAESDLGEGVQSLIQDPKTSRALSTLRQSLFPE